MKEIEFECDLKERQWNGTAVIMGINKDICIAKVNARDTTFTAVLNCYCEIYGMQEWCIYVPDWNFAFRISKISAEWNEEQFSKYVKNKVDRRSLVCAVEALFDEIKSCTGTTERS